MKKRAFWFQITMSSLWIIGAISLIVFWLWGDKDALEINGGEIFSIATIAAIIGLWKILETHKTQKEFQKHFQKNEEDKSEIEEMKKEILK